MVTKCSFLVFVCVMLSCTQESTVTVEGAVEREGPIAHDSTWVVEDYVAHAELSPEADPVRRTLITESEDPVSGDAVLSHAPVSAGARLVPAAGSIIRVPHKRYVLSFEQVYEVTSLELEVEDRRFEIPAGVLAVAQIATGPVGGVLIGEGKAFDIRSGEMITPFHYVYMRASPSWMDSLLTTAGTAKENLETLEDAVEVHRLHRDRVGFETEHAVTRPPEGTLQAVPGIWLNPRSERTPGRGMRRRRFDDGRIWTTYPDGRQRWVYVDGRVEMRHPGGLTETRETDGRVIRTDLTGTKRIQHPDGLREVVLASGSRKIIRTDGSVTYLHFGGTTVTITSEGERRARYADGTLHVELIDGTTETTYPDGRQERRLLSGWTEVEAADGVTARVDPEGRRVVTQPDGIRIYELANGVRVEWHPDGSVRSQFPDGTRLIRDVLGQLTRYAPDGRIVGDGGAGDHSQGLFEDQGWDLEVVDTAIDVSYLNAEAKDIVKELNKVRTDPQKYAEEVVKPVLAFYDGRRFRLPGRGTVLTREGAAAAQELYEELLRREPVTAVGTAEGLAAAAGDHVRDQGPTGRVGHIGEDGSTPAERVTIYGTSRITGECVAYGRLYGGMFLLQLLIDDGVEDRGHRRALLDSRFRVVGVATGSHSVFLRMCDIVLADWFKGE